MKCDDFVAIYMFTFFKISLVNYIDVFLVFNKNKIYAKDKSKA
ncbi:hypothetical protein MEG_00115 [Bartonella tamiae Th307]|nr:hypothetical protein MEG_00115 [Bartonella tamiae Th307]